MLKPFWTALLIVIVIAGCASPAHKLEVAAVKKLTLGMQRSAVERQFGPPLHTYSGPAGYTMAYYEFGQPVIVTGPSPDHFMLRSLSLLYGADGVLVKKLHDESKTPVQRQRDFFEVGPRLDGPDVSRAIRPNDTVEQLKMHFGEPSTRALTSRGHIQLIWYYYKRRYDRLGLPENRMLTVLLNEENRVANYELQEKNVRSWFSKD